MLLQTLAQEKKGSLTDLMGLVMDKMLNDHQQRIKKDFDLLEQRLKLAHQQMRKLKMEVAKTKAEWEFYKDMYKKRIGKEEGGIIPKL